MTTSPTALMKQYAHLVPATRRRFIPNVPVCVEVGDLEGAGYLGLARAAVRFEAGHGAEFRSWAIKCIRGEMLEYLRTWDPVPRSLREAERRGEAVVIPAAVSFETLLFAGSEEDRDLTIADVLPSREPTPEAWLEETLAREALMEMLAGLHPKYRFVVIEHGLKERTFKAIGGDLGRGEGRASQIWHEALAQLRAEARPDAA